MHWSQVNCSILDYKCKKLFHIIFFISRFGRRNEIIPINAAKGDVVLDRNGKQRHGNNQEYPSEIE